MSIAIKAGRARSQGAGRILPGRGDPGFFDFIKGAVKTGISLVTGGPAAAVGTAISQFRGGGGRPPPGPVFSAPIVQAPGIGAAISRLVPGGSTGLQVGAVPAGMKLACPGGFHPNKSSYHLMSGAFVVKGSRCVRNRRTNPLNPRAADKAIRRIESAKRATKSLARITIRKAD